MGRQKKTQYGFGFDPSINDPAWAVVGTDGSVRCGLIRNPYRKAEGLKTDHWAKLEVILDHMQAELGQVLKKLPPLVSWTCEGQYCQRRGNQEHNVRLGWVSSMVYTMGQGRAKRIIAVPATWTKNKPKELRHPELLDGLQPEDKWVWVGPEAPPSLIHNVYDAVGLALWGLAKNMEVEHVGA